MRGTGYGMWVTGFGAGDQRSGRVDTQIHILLGFVDYTRNQILYR